MESEQAVKQINLEKITTLLGPYHFIATAYQFGSTARSQEGPLSDLDIAILVCEQRVSFAVELLRIELLLAYELQKQLKISHVDLITLNRQRLTFQYAILRTGWLIYNADPKCRIRFVQKVIQDYLDFQPTLKLVKKFHIQGRLQRCGIQTLRSTQDE